MRIILALIVLLVGITLLIGIAPVMESFVEGMIADTPGVTDFELSFWGLMPYILLVFVLIAVLVTLIKPSTIMGMFNRDGRDE